MCSYRWHHGAKNEDAWCSWLCDRRKVQRHCRIEGDRSSSRCNESISLNVCQLTEQVFAQGRSTVGTGAEASVYARNIPVSVSDVRVSPVSKARWAHILLLMTTGRHHIL